MRELKAFWKDVMKPFTSAEIELYELTEKEKALNWIKENM
jgi:hypothetical protein